MLEIRARPGSQWRVERAGRFDGVVLMVGIARALSALSGCGGAASLPDTSG
jgi:hypothetical protein